MKIFYKAYCRIFQKCLYVGCFFLDFSEPKLISDNEGIKKIPEILKDKKILIVTDETLYSLGLIKPLEEELNREKRTYKVFKNVVPNPTIENVEEGLKVYKENGLDAIVAIGGGSVMDCAKTIGARATNPKKSVSKMKGLLKLRHKLPPLIAVPTTAGTGSETTLAAVISDPKNKDKYAIEDPKLIPDYAFLDPNLLVGLPYKVTSTTGMDALCHAVEAYIGSSNTSKTKDRAEKAVKLIFENLEKSCQEPKNLTYRTNMQLAAYYAGIAFTRAYVGYVHSLSHAVSAFYNTPHGLAIAICMPYVLKAYGKKAYKKLAKLADIVGIKGDSIQDKANKFIQAIEELNSKLNIPSSFEGIIKKEDIPTLAQHAAKEGNPLYPVPKIMSAKELEKIYYEMI